MLRQDLNKKSNARELKFLKNQSIFLWSIIINQHSLKSYQFRNIEFFWKEVFYRLTTFVMIQPSNPNRGIQDWAFFKDALEKFMQQIHPSHIYWEKKSRKTNILSYLPLCGLMGLRESRQLWKFIEMSAENKISFLLHFPVAGQHFSLISTQKVFIIENVNWT